MARIARALLRECELSVFASEKFVACFVARERRFRREARLADGGDRFIAPIAVATVCAAARGFAKHGVHA